MATMKAKQRNALPKTSFGLPAKRKFPVNDKPHAANAKARASQGVNAGTVTPAEKAQIDAAADETLGETS